MNNNTLIKFSLEYILTFRDYNNDLPKIDKKFIVRTNKKRKNRVKKEVKEIKHTIENPWLSSKEKRKKSINQNKDDKIKSKFTYLLNKLCYNNFDFILKEVLKLKIDGYKIFKDLVDIIYQKCITEDNFIKLYVIFIKNLDNKIQPIQIKNIKITFARIFIENCHNCYKNWELDDKIKINNNILIIGNLYNYNIISENIINECIKNFLNQTNEYGIDLLIKLLLCIGEKYENNNFDNFNDIIKKLQKKNISSKNKFAVMDLIDLRNKHWNNEENIVKNKKITNQKIKDNIKNILLEYLDVLDTEEIKEYFLEYTFENKEKLFTTLIIELYIEQTIENKKYLLELLEYMIKNNFLPKKEFIEYIKLIKQNIDTYKIDYPNINSDILVINEKLK